ncbi:hypothetical protein BOTBODRAFT_73713, partial [Botryobasidium botryosum FD-172 SS1]
ITIKDNFIYSHKHIRLNSTSYDVRRGHDSLSLRSNRGDIFVASADSEVLAHPFWYARVIRIFHVFVLDLANPNVQTKRVEFLWVQWF